MRRQLASNDDLVYLCQDILPRLARDHHMSVSSDTVVSKRRKKRKNIGRTTMTLRVHRLVAQKNTPYAGVNAKIGNAWGVAVASVLLMLVHILKA